MKLGILQMSKDYHRKILEFSWNVSTKAHFIKELKKKRSYGLNLKLHLKYFVNLCSNFKIKKKTNIGTENNYHETISMHNCIVTLLWALFLPHKDEKGIFPTYTVQV